MGTIRIISAGKAEKERTEKMEERREKEYGSFNGLSGGTLEAFRTWLLEEEKSAATIEKYLRDVRAFQAFGLSRKTVREQEKALSRETDREQGEALSGETGREREEALSRELVREWKQALLDAGYAVNSINSMLASLNCFLRFLGRTDCRVRSLKTQRRTYCPEEKELTRAEYLRLLEAAAGRPQLRLLLETICGTGIRVSELKYFTAETVKNGQIEIRCKGKIRTILIPGKLQKRLLDYAKKNGIRSGALFLGRDGQPLSRSCIWGRMKRLCAAARVQACKVFPHNLRKLFARAFYAIEKDIAKLADVLGHSSINTTRIYIMTTGLEHRRQLERLGLVV